MEFLAAALVLGLFVVPFGVPVTALVRLVAVLAVPICPHSFRRVVVRV